MDLLEKCLSLKANNRPNIKDIMNHKYFKDIKLAVPLYISSPVAKMDVK
jgi:serine/threonine protein kinase